VRRWIPALALFSLAFASSRASAQYNFDHWTADTGLPQNIIRAIHQTPDGYLWLATLDGLVRFDGVRFAVFNRMNSPGINSNRFIALYEDREGALWLGTESSGVTRYHRGRFTTYTTQHGLTSNVVLGISGDKEGNTLVLSGDQVMRWSDGRFLAVGTITLSNDLGTGQTVIERDNKGGFWGVNDRGLSHFTNGRLSVLAQRDGLPSLNIHSVAEDGHGALWVATRDAGLVRIGAGRVAPARKGAPGKRAWFIAGPEIKGISEDRQGAFWLTDLDSGLSHLLTRQLPPALAPFDYCRLYEDREGNIWIGTEGGGLYRARKQSITVYSKQEGLAGPNTYPIYEDREGAIWIGAQGLNRFAGGVFANFTAREGLASPSVSAIGEDRDGRLWIGTAGGLQVFSGGRLRIARELSDVLAAPQLVQAICQDREGALWFGADTGLVRYQNGVAAKFTTRDGMASDDVKVIIEGASGRLWIGSYGGLTSFKDGKFTAYTERDGLPSNSVRALYEDRDGVLWVGTYDGGLGRFKDGRFTRYTTRDGLFNDGVFQILDDARGNFWMSSNRGIYRVRKQELDDFAEGKLRSIYSTAYGKADGMLNAECNGGRWPAGIRARDGRLWFPTQDGAAVIDPETIQTNPQPPPVMIESFLLDREPVAIDPQLRAVRVTPDKENFEIGYTALSFINSEHIRFRYKLEDLDHDWTEAGTRRSVYYSHIPPGDYVFRVIAANSDGVWNPTGQSLQVIVLAPFYRRLWFSSLVALAVVGLAAGGVRLRFNQLRKARAAQEQFSRQLIESQEAERKRIAAELHDSLSQSLVIIKNRALLGLQTPGDPARTSGQLEEIVEATGSAIDEVKEIAYALRPFHLDRLGLAHAIEVMLERVTETSGLRFLTEFDPLDGVFSPEIETHLYRIVQECVNNIVKHARATEAKVSIRRVTRAVIVKIEDNGRGFTPGTSDHAGHAGSPAGGGNHPRRGGFGLSGLTERARIIGGQISIESAPGRGATITVRISGGQFGTKEL